jgi:D-glycero-alpha-D-manno-heptose-7-phosphate kinase
MAAALAAFRQQAMSPAELAEWSRAVEAEELKIAGGRQDHYAAAFGGALGLRFEGSTTVEQIPLEQRTVTALQRRCILAYTGESRISADTITAVLDAYLARDARVVSALERMKSLALAMRDAIAAGDVDVLAALVDEHWTHQRSLHPRITTPRIDALEAAARDAGASGVKALGASGGGCVIVFAEEDDVEHVRRAIAPFANVMEWSVSLSGVSVSATA